MEDNKSIGSELDVPGTFSLKPNAKNPNRFSAQEIKKMKEPVKSDTKKEDRRG
jgi:hypothetical protein